MIYFINQLTAIASLAASFRNAITTAVAIVEYLMSQESKSPWFIETDGDYNDYWTADLAVHRVELSNGQALPVLCESPSHAWDKIEAWLLERNDYTTSILKITRDEW